MVLGHLPTEQETKPSSAPSCAPCRTTPYPLATLRSRFRRPGVRRARTGSASLWRPTPLTAASTGSLWCLLRGHRRPEPDHASCVGSDEITCLPTVERRVRGVPAADGTPPRVAVDHLAAEGGPPAR